MNTIVKINDTQVRVIEYQGQRVATLAQIDDVHERADGTARKRFNDNRERFLEGEDFIKVSASEFRTRFPGMLSERATEDVTLMFETGYLMLVKSFTDDLAWQVQRQLVNGYFRVREVVARPAKKPAAKSLTRTQASIAEMLIKSAAEHLKLAPSAVLGCYQRLESMAGVPGLLPAYSVDAPSTAPTGSSEETKSAAELLEIHGVGMSAIAFNRLLVQNGFLEERERASTKGNKVKKFKVCTNLEFGKNLTNASNPRETQPHWYVSKFAELLGLVLPPKPKAVTA